MDETEINGLGIKYLGIFEKRECILVRNKCNHKLFEKCKEITDKEVDGKYKYNTLNGYQEYTPFYRSTGTSDSIDARKDTWFPFNGIMYDEYVPDIPTYHFWMDKGSSSSVNHDNEKIQTFRIIGRSHMIDEYIDDPVIFQNNNFITPNPEEAPISGTILYDKFKEIYNKNKTDLNLLQIFPRFRNDRCFLLSLMLGGGLWNDASIYNATWNDYKDLLNITEKYTVGTSRDALNGAIGINNDIGTNNEYGIELNNNYCAELNITRFNIIKHKNLNEDYLKKLRDITTNNIKFTKELFNERFKVMKNQDIDKVETVNKILKYIELNKNLFIDYPDPDPVPDPVPDSDLYLDLLDDGGLKFILKYNYEYSDRIIDQYMWDNIPTLGNESIVKLPLKRDFNIYSKRQNYIFQINQYNQMPDYYKQLNDSYNKILTEMENEKGQQTGGKRNWKKSKVNKTRKSRTRKSKTRKSKTRKSRTRKSKTRKSKTRKSRTRKSRTRKSKTRKSRQ